MNLAKAGSMNMRILRWYANGRLAQAYPETTNAGAVRMSQRIKAKYPNDTIEIVEIIRTSYPLRATG